MSCINRINCMKFSMKIGTLTQNWWLIASGDTIFKAFKVLNTTRAYVILCLVSKLILFDEYIDWVAKKKINKTVDFFQNDGWIQDGFLKLQNF
jgi:hypothetical protein